jgi:CDP-diacylglycerol--glycerol-3-phosphate 3-phosphatidyltransferase
MKGVTMNLPMSITVLRILAIPLVVLFYMMPFQWAHGVAVVLFLLAALSDWLDGYLARLLSQTTDFGAFLDPVADKLLVCVCLVMILGAHPVMGLSIPIAVIIAREITVSAFREWMSGLGKRDAAGVRQIGKIKTGVQMTAIFLLLLYTETAPVWMKWLGYGALWLAALLTVYSLYQYTRLAWNDLTLSQEKE